MCKKPAMEPIAIRNKQNKTQVNLLKIWNKLLVLSSSDNISGLSGGICHLCARD